MEPLLIVAFVASCLLAMVVTAILCRFADNGPARAYQRIKLKEIRNNALVEQLTYK